MTYVLDTNIISSVLKNNQTVIDKIKTTISSGETILINCISYYEIKRGLLAVKATTKITRFDNFCKHFGLLFLDSLPILDEAADIWAYLKGKGKQIGDADTLIASMAKINRCILVTNDPDFDKVPNLNTENWVS